MKKKEVIVVFVAILTLFLIQGVLAEITTLDVNTVNPGDTIRLTIKPTKQGFYHLIYVMQNTTQIDVIDANCGDTICTKRTVLYYTVPLNFVGEYYFATFDYSLGGSGDWEYDYFTVIQQQPEGQLTIEHIMNSQGGVNTLINPEQGKNASIEISTLLEITDCDTYSVDAYLCNSSVGSCSNSSFTHNISLPFARKAGKKCWFDYIGEDYFPFYQTADNWTLFIESGVLSDRMDFTYTSLIAVNYSSFIDFGNLNARTWNIGIPSPGINLTNSGNVPYMVSWNSSGFDCVSPNCRDFWYSYINGESNFQIDDDTYFMETNETGLLPTNINNFTNNFFPQTDSISTCISSSCDNNLGEKILTFFNLRISSIEPGEYQGDIIISLYP